MCAHCYRFTYFNYKDVFFFINSWEYSLTFCKKAHLFSFLLYSSISELYFIWWEHCESRFSSIFFLWVSNCPRTIIKDSCSPMPTIWKWGVHIHTVHFCTLSSSAVWVVYPYKIVHFCYRNFIISYDHVNDVLPSCFISEYSWPLEYSCRAHIYLQIQLTYWDCG